MIKIYQSSGLNCYLEISSIQANCSGRSINTMNINEVELG